MKRYNLKSFRIVRGMTQANMANELGLSTNYYKSVENGLYDPSEKVWEKLSAIFQLTDDQLEALKVKAVAIGVKEVK